VARDGSAVVRELDVELGAADGTLERGAEAERLALETDRLEGEAREAAQELEAASVAAAAARTALGTARGLEASAGGERRRLDEEERRASRALESATREVGWHRDQAGRLEVEVRRLRELLARLEPAAVAPVADGPLTSAEGPAEPGGSAAAAWAARAADLRSRRDRLAEQIAATEVTRRESDGRRARAEATVALREERLRAIDRELEGLGVRTRDNAAAVDAAAREVAETAARVAAARAAVERVVSAGELERERLAAAERSTAMARERLRVAEDSAHAAERAALEADLGLDALREQLLADLAALGEAATARLGVAAPPPRRVPAVDTADDQDSIVAALQSSAATWAAVPPPADPPTPARLAALRRRYHELGAANPYALEEHEALKARLEQLETQRADLLVAVERTRRVIDELGTLIADQFQATFRALETAFDQRFRQLFAGGSARLELTDPSDPGSTGIEITARPPGKKRQPLAMLSGGERSLTAVALLLAMLQVRPVPFCVLDEVDAALDEANVGRFTSALRELAEATQFVVITHNRGTIRSADALYGVTVGDDSVSRVISLRLDGAPPPRPDQGQHGLSEGPETVSARA
jgi:chromosome segregation protein